MSVEEQPIPLGERLIGAALVAPIRLARLLPYRWRVPFAGWLTSYVMAPLAGYRKRVRENLAIARPELSHAEVERLARRVPNNAGRNMIELYSPEFPALARRAAVVGPGLPEAHAASAEGRPVIFVTAHFSAFNAARVAMMEQGFRMGIFYRPMANRPFNEHYTTAMGTLSQPMFEQGRRGMIQMVRHLHSGGVVAIFNDLNAHDGVPLEFFGQPALTSLAPAEMALKFNALVVPVWGLRNPDGLTFTIETETSIPLTDPVTMTREFNTRLEAAVCAHMDQWFWVHRRWKDGTGWLAERGDEKLRKLEDQAGSG